TGQQPTERRQEAARRNYLGRDKNKRHPSCANPILEHLATLADDPIHSLSRVFAAESQREGRTAEGVFDGMTPPPGLVGILEKAPDNATPGKGAEGVFDGMTPPPGLVGILEKAPDNATPERFVQWADSWEASSWERVSLSALILDLNPQSPPHAELVRPLLTDAVETLKKEEKDKTRLVLADIHHARCLGQLGRRPEAVEILEALLSELPDETLSDLLPAGAADLTRGEGGQLIKV
ncbi:MAG: hypothetical protein GY859_38515, partial [Desulfobacterales bacterium]|nr:hypothetical protein [Desulfobacterales bacterium]